VRDTVWRKSIPLAAPARAKEDAMSATNCELCDPAMILMEEELAYVRFDNHALSPGHVLVVPRRHVASFFDMTMDEKTCVLTLLDRAKAHIETKHAPDGYNIGVNIGRAGGQSRMHVHVHLIPRYEGDVTNPQGGIRCVLAGKQTSAPGAREDARGTSGG
jgi:diadenosine tetraphosphate (Ap4A) HIT family hydrolase